MGVLHRDLKPANIMLLKRKDDDGQTIDVAKVCDFGIAKLIEGPQEETTDRGKKHLTAGLVIGTPEYMSPEQARGERIDARSDLYAVGIVLYQMLSGRVPFEAATALSVVLKQVSDEPVAPSAVCPGIEPSLEAICLKALKKKAADRFQSAIEMRLALRSALAQPGMGTPVPSPVSIPKAMPVGAPRTPPPTPLRRLPWVASTARPQR